MRLRKLKQEFEAIAHAADASVHLELDRPHGRAVFAKNGRSRFIVFTKTRTDYHGQRNIIAQARRTLRELEA